MISTIQRTNNIHKETPADINYYHLFFSNIHTCKIQCEVQDRNENVGKKMITVFVHILSVQYTQE